MEVDQYTDVSVTMEVDMCMTTDEGYDRYMRLHAIVEDIKNNQNGRMADWYAEHNALLDDYNNHFKGNFGDIHPYITDGTFRNDCITIQVLINKLMNEFKIFHWFTLYDYLKLNQAIIRVVDAAYAYEESVETDISDLFTNMKV